MSEAHVPPRADHLRQGLAIYSDPSRGYMRYARSGRAYAQSRNVLVRDVRVPGFSPTHCDIPLNVLVNYEERTFLS